MKRLLLSLAVLAAASIAFAATAQVTVEVPLPPSGPPATPEGIARARAHADALIARAGVADLFENVTTTDVARVRHRPSGLTCSFKGHPDDQLSVSEEPKSRTDVAQCLAVMDGVTVKTNVVRLPRPLPVDYEAALFIGAFQAEHPDARPVPATVEVQPQDGPPIQSARFVYRDGAARRYAYVGVAVVNGWTIIKVAIGPQDQAKTIDMVGGAGLSGEVNDIAKASSRA
jgi:hypothetical protein